MNRCPSLCCRRVGIRNHPAAGRANADDVYGDLTRARLSERLRHTAAPRLTVSHHDECARIAALAVQLFVLLDDTKAPADAFLDVRVPGRQVFESERRTVAQMIEEEEQRVRVLGQPDLRRAEVREERQ